MGGKGNILQMVGEPGSGYTRTTSGLHGNAEEVPRHLARQQDLRLLLHCHGKQAMETILNTTPDVTGVLCQGGHMALGVLEAYADKKLPYPAITVDDINLFIIAAKKMKFTNFVVVSGGSEAGRRRLRGRHEGPERRAGEEDHALAGQAVHADEMDKLIPPGCRTGTGR